MYFEHEIYKDKVTLVCKMDIFKSFILNGTNYSVNVLWDDEKPYFRASEIGEILQLVKVRNAISDFDDDEKIEKGALSAGGLQKTLFLTEAGLYRLLKQISDLLKEQAAHYNTQPSGRFGIYFLYQNSFT